MKVMLEQKDLAKLVATVSRAAASNTTVPILTGMMLEAEGGKLTATSLDLAIGIKMSTTEIQLDEPGKVVVNAHHLAELVKKLPTGVITLETKDGKLNVKYGRSRANINTFNETDWVGFPDAGYEEKFCISQKALKAGLQNVVFATAKNHFRQIFTGVLIDNVPAENELRFVGTDTHRMALHRVPLENLTPWKPVIPTPAVAELIRLLQGEDEISVGMSGNNILFKWGEVEMFSRLIEGEYPDYLRVIPASSVSEVEFDPAKIKECVDRINALPTSNKEVPVLCLNINGSIEMGGKSADAGEVQEICNYITKNGEDIEIKFNTDYFLDALKLMPETTKIAFAGKQAPAIMQGEPHYLVVLVPLRSAA